MMHKLSWHNSFKRSFNKYTRHNHELKERVFKTIDELSKDPLHPNPKCMYLAPGQMIAPKAEISTYYG